MNQIVILGAGHGGFQLAASLRQNGFDGRVLLISDEPGLPYQRPPLSKEYLEGKIGPDLLLMRPEAFYRDHRIELIADERAVRIDPAAREVTLARGTRLGYHHLVLATGARNRAPPVPGLDLEGVCYLRSRAETDALQTQLAEAQTVVVIGAGFIGLEFAAVAAAKGKRVHIVEIADRVMGRVVAVETSGFFAAKHREAGVQFTFGMPAVAILGQSGRVRAVELRDGTRLAADLVLVSIGVAPNAELAAEAGLAIVNGVLVDDRLRTADPAISAIGDCAAFPSRHARIAPVRLESVQNAADHARCVADRLTGKDRPYASLPWFWSEQGALRLQIAGLTTEHDRTAIRGRIEDGSFSVFCYAGHTLLGIESINRPADHAIGRRLLAAGRQVSPAEAADESFDLRAAATSRAA
ncbi:MAG: FAD-dependent oxidoreductase [Alphaproteobacteria bacterium]|nr:FAD-dependent oxidoreductase [Alphaproteobacteria bacterium]